MEQMEAMVQQLQQQLQTMNDTMVAQNAASVQTAVVYEARLVELREVAVSAAKKGPGRKPGLVDTKGVGRRATFDGTQSKWSGWAFKVQNFIASVYAQGCDTLDWAATRESMIVEEDLKEEESLSLTEIMEINESVYALLAQITDMEPLDITKNTARGAGLEVWRKL